MPLIYTEDLPESAKIGVWHITEDLQFFESAGLQAREIAHPQKRLQHLAGRKLLRTLAPASSVYKIDIGPTGKPFFPDTNPHFSVSHAGNYAAVIVCEKHNCGCDIELFQPKIVRISFKFMSDREQKVLFASGLDEVQSSTVAWSVKEAVFKWYEAGSVDFKEDIQIADIMRLETDGKAFQIRCAFAKIGGDVTVSMLVEKEFVLARIVGDLK